jgi:hypothetical protein
MRKAGPSNRSSTLEALPNVSRVLVVKALELFIELFVLRGC